MIISWICTTYIPNLKAYLDSKFQVQNGPPLGLLVSPQVWPGPLHPSFDPKEQRGPNISSHGSFEKHKLSMNKNWGSNHSILQNLFKHISTYLNKTNMFEDFEDLIVLIYTTGSEIQIHVRLHWLRIVHQNPWQGGWRIGDCCQHQNRQKGLDKPKQKQLCRVSRFFSKIF